MSFFKRLLLKQRGEINLTVFLMALLGVAIGVLTTALIRSLETTWRQRRAVQYNMTAYTMAETLHLAYRLAELRYQDLVLPCASARSFHEAIRIGHGCASLGSIAVFTNADLAFLGLTADTLYSYTNPCNLSDNSGCQSPTNNAAHPSVLEIGLPLANQPQRINNYAFAVHVGRVVPQKGYLEFIVRTYDWNQLTSAGIPTERRAQSVTFRGQPTSIVHVDFNLRLVAEAFSSLSPCATSAAWAPYQVLSAGACTTISAVGGSFSLASYPSTGTAHLFSFRETDGQVFQLAPDGTAPVALAENSSPTFPDHRRNQLVRAGDFSTIGNQIYFTRDAGASSSLWVMEGANIERLCFLTSWSQHIVGLVAYPWSNTLYPAPSSGVRLAYFDLKTDAGDFLHLSVRRTTSAVTCTITKDAAAQRVEYKRTYGIDRALENQENSPFIVY